MNRSTHLLAIIGITTLAAASHAEAHDWYSKQYDPVTHGWCCNTANGDGYGDCAQLVLEPGVLTGEPGGFRLRLTVDQAQRINPLRRSPVDTFIPDARVQPSNDGNWHLCIPPIPVPARNDFYCFFMPGGS